MMVATADAIILIEDMPLLSLLYVAYSLSKWVNHWLRHIVDVVEAISLVWCEQVCCYLDSFGSFLLGRTVPVWS